MSSSMAASGCGEFAMGESSDDKKIQTLLGYFKFSDQGSYVTGLIEVSSAVALLVPSFAVFGALALVATMIGAIAAHIFVIGGSPAMPMILLLGSAGVLWARRNQLLR
jgi:uncharacterized membrane protein